MTLPPEPPPPPAIEDWLVVLADPGEKTGFALLGILLVAKTQPLRAAYILGDLLTTALEMPIAEDASTASLLVHISLHHALRRVNWAGVIFRVERTYPGALGKATAPAPLPDMKYPPARGAKKGPK